MALKQGSKEKKHSDALWVERDTDSSIHNIISVAPKQGPHTTGTKRMTQAKKKSRQLFRFNQEIWLITCLRTMSP